MQTPKKTIGILGGMGPEASAYFYNLLIKLAHTKYGAVQDTDFPPIIIYNLPLFGFDETGITDEKLVEDQLVAGVKKLESAGSDFILIACNTVHKLQPVMQAALHVPILGIIDETVHEAVRKGYRKVGLLTSESTNRMGLYVSKLQEHGIDSIAANAIEQEKLNQIILHVMSGTHDDADDRTIRDIAAGFVERGADAIILGCTELPLAVGRAEFPVPLLNSNEIITDRALSVAFEQ